MYFNTIRKSQQMMAKILLLLLIKLRMWLRVNPRLSRNRAG